MPVAVQTDSEHLMATSVEVQTVSVIPNAKKQVTKEVQVSAMPSEEETKPAVRGSYEL